MEWMVGLDLDARSQGAIRFASWLRRESIEPQPPYAAVHVLERIDESLAARWSVHTVAELEHFARAAAQQCLQDLGVEGDFQPPRVLGAENIEAALADECGEGGVDGLILGRAGAIGARTFPRLGRVARRVLRVLPLPVMVVPPDLQPHDLPAGPVLVASDLRAHSTAAVRFAAKLGASLDRPVTLVHVAPQYFDSGPSLLPRPLDQGARLEYEHEVRQRVEGWRIRAGLPALGVEVEFGRPLERILATAERLGSPIIACGSRRLSVAERVFQVSTGSRLAGAAHGAVVVVPGDA